MVSTTTTDSGRKHIPMQYLDMLWNKYEKYGSETNRLVMGINDKGLGRGWKSLITKGYPRGRFFFNYADLLLTSPYRGENHKYYFQLQYFLYDRKNDELYVDLDGSTFKVKLKNGMHTTNFEISHELLKGKSEVFVKLCFREKFLKEISEYSSFFDGVMEKMDNNTFKEYATNFKDLFVIEVSILSDDSQYLRNELAKID